MRTVTFQKVLNGVAACLGLDPLRDLNPARATTLAGYITDRCTEGWKFDFWPEWTVCEQRQYRDTYNGATNYVATNEVWHPGSLQYYQALTATTGHAPATYANGIWTPNANYWAVSAAGYDSLGDFVAGTNYALGAQVRNPDDNQPYQCFVPGVSGGALDPAQFGLLTPFNRYIAAEQTGRTPIDEVKSVSRQSPRVRPNNPGYVEFQRSADGVQVDRCAPNVVWVQFRLRPPQFTATPWKSTTAYNAGDCVLRTTTGECYVATAATTGQDPATTPNVWTRQPLPALLQNWVKRAAFSDGMNDEKQTDRKAQELTDAHDELEDARDREFDAQGQYDSATVVTARSPQPGWGATYRVQPGGYR